MKNIGIGMSLQDKKGIAYAINSVWDTTHARTINKIEPNARRVIFKNMHILDQAIDLHLAIKLNIS